MRLVFVTQVIDAGDAVLGFVTRWVQGLARHAEQVRVLALEAGDVSTLPANVDVRVIGRRGTIRRFLRYRRLLREAFREGGFDAILTHMVPRYSSVAAPLARRYGVRHFLWYTHKGVDARLEKALGVVEKVFTASADSMRVETEKRVVTGHGIDLEHFRFSPSREDGRPRLLSVGRLTPAKDPLCILEALAHLRTGGQEVSLEWAGGALTAGDAGFAAEVRARVAELGLQDHVRFLGPVPYAEIPLRYQAATLFVSGSRTGSVDKVVLEAMASGRPVVTCNESFPPLFAELGTAAAGLAFEPGDSEQLARRVLAHLDAGARSRDELGQRLRAVVARDHEVDSLMLRLVREMGSEA